MDAAGQVRSRAGIKKIKKNPVTMKCIESIKSVGRGGSERSNVSIYFLHEQKKGLEANNNHTTKEKEGRHFLVILIIIDAMIGE
jgi:hypothetical protein